MNEKTYTKNCTEAYQETVKKMKPIMTKPMNKQEWIVILNGVDIGIVFLDKKLGRKLALSNLVNDYGYNKNITIIKQRIFLDERRTGQ